MGKIEREKKIFNLIYGDKKYYKIITREKPDFQLLHNCGHSFGVEITEFFYNESFARKTLISNYTKEILENEKYLHKDDKINLPKTLMTFKANDKSEPRNIYGIFYETPSIKDSINKLTKIINIKEKAFIGYNAELNHINLIIYDNQNFLNNINEDSFYKNFFFKPLVKAIIQSSFYEIFFITKHKEFGFGYLPLKSLLWSSTFFLYRKIYHTYLNKTQRNINEFLTYFALFSKHLGFNNIYIDTKDSLTFYYCNSKITLEPKTFNLSFLEDNIDSKKYPNLFSFLPNCDEEAFIQFIDNFTESAYLTLFIKINNEILV